MRPKDHSCFGLLSKYSPHRPIPKFVRSFGFRLFMVFFIFAMFGIHGTGILENHTADYHRRRNPVLHLCSPHMVQFLSDGISFIMGGSQESSIAKGI